MSESDYRPRRNIRTLTQRDFIAEETADITHRRGTPDVRGESLVYKVRSVIEAVERACSSEGTMFTHNPGRAMDTFYGPLMGLYENLESLERDVIAHARRADYMSQSAIFYMSKCSVFVARLCYCIMQVKGDSTLKNYLSAPLLISTLLIGGVFKSKNFPHDVKIRKITKALDSNGVIDNAYVASFNRIARHLNPTINAIVALISLLSLIVDEEGHSVPVDDTTPQPGRPSSTGPFAEASTEEDHHTAFDSDPSPTEPLPPTRARSPSIPRSPSPAPAPTPFTPLSPRSYLASLSTVPRTFPPGTPVWKRNFATTHPLQSLHVGTRELHVLTGTLRCAEAVLEAARGTQALTREKEDLATAMKDVFDGWNDAWRGLATERDEERERNLTMFGEIR